MEKKQIIHAVAIGSALVLNLSATAYAAQSGDACTNGTATAVASDASYFVKNNFTPKCSNNTSVKFAQTATDFYVKGASSKGMHTYGGSTEGGGVGVCENSSIANPQSSIAPGTSTVTGFPLGC